MIWLELQNSEYQSENNNKGPPLKELVCCPLKSKSVDAKCDEEGGCKSADRCVARGVKEAWVKAGLPTVTDVSIRYATEKRDIITKLLLIYIFTGIRLFR